MTFIECATQCAVQKSFVAELERLHGKKFCFLHPRTPLEAEIDRATGREDDDTARWLNAVYDLVWSRVDLRAA